MLDRTIADGTISFIQALLSALRRVTMGTDLPQFAHASCLLEQRPCNLTTGVYGWMIAILTDRVDISVLTSRWQVFFRCSTECPELLC